MFPYMYDDAKARYQAMSREADEARLARSLRRPRTPFRWNHWWPRLASMFRATRGETVVDLDDELVAALETLRGRQAEESIEAGRDDGGRRTPQNPPPRQPAHDVESPGEDPRAGADLTLCNTRL